MLPASSEAEHPTVRRPLPEPLGHATALLVIVLAPVVTACGDAGDAGGWAGTIDTLENGAVLVSNPAEGIWTDETAWRLVEEVRIGSVEGDGADMFAQVHDVAVDGADRIYVLDRQYQDIRVFDAEGGHVRTIGRRGGGPGEFDGAYGMDIDPRDRLWVVERARYSVFDSTGAFLTTYPRRVTVWGFQWSGGFMGDGQLLDIVTGGLVRYDTAARAFVDTFPIPRSPREPEVFDFRDERGSGSIMAVPFTSGFHWKVGPKGLMWTGDSEQYRVYLATLVGDTLRAIARSYEPVPVTAAERDSVLDAVRKRAAGRHVDAGKVPRVKPAFQRIDVDDRGYLWVRPSLPHGLTGVVFDVFDAEGRYLGHIATNNRFASYAPLEIRGDRLYGVDRDTLGVQYVVRMRIEGRSARRAETR